MGKQTHSIDSETKSETRSGGTLDYLDGAINQTPITKIAKNAPLDPPQTNKTETFATKIQGFDALDEAINNTPITKIVKDGIQAKKLEKPERKQYYGYVESDLDALKSVLKARYKLTDEAAGVFSAKLDTAARIEKLRDELEWPPTKIELYEDRKPLPETGKKETAIEFYNRRWKRYAEAWLISQEILKNKFGEDKLVPGIKSQCHREQRDFVKHAPPSQVKLNDYLASIDLGGSAQSYLEKNRARANKFRNDTLK